MQAYLWYNEGNSTEGLDPEGSLEPNELVQLSEIDHCYDSGLRQGNGSSCRRMHIGMTPVQTELS